MIGPGNDILIDGVLHNVWSKHYNSGNIAFPPPAPARQGYLGLLSLGEAGSLSAVLYFLYYAELRRRRSLL